MNTWKNAARRLQEEIANAGAPSRGDQVPLLEADGNDDQAPVNPPPLIDNDISAAFLHMDKSTTTHAQASTTQD